MLMPPNVMAVTGRAFEARIAAEIVIKERE
jgi:hypothetical protein